MAVKKLVLDDFFQDEQFSLIAIHSIIEDYRLAFLLNKTLNIKLARQNKDVDNNSVNFSLFEWYDNSQFKTWHLVSNTNKTIEYKEENNQSLFNFNQTKTHHLVQEYNTANYILKINSELSLTKETQVLNKILNINQVVTAYKIPTENLKSKNQLIFN